MRAVGTLFVAYDLNALEPYVGSKTMDVYHDKHHASYVTKLNKALEERGELRKKNLTDLRRK